MHIASVGLAAPANYCRQEELIAAFSEHTAGRFHNPERLASIMRNTQVEGRHLAFPIEEYLRLDGFTANNDAHIRCAVELGEAAIRDGLARAGLAPAAVDYLIVQSITGIASPSTDASLVNRLGLRPDVKRVPVFGWGCPGGAMGISRVADYLLAYPDQVGVALSVELNSLILQKDDHSLTNVVAFGLFGDCAAAVVMTGSRRGACSPRVAATRSVFFPETEHLMGYRIGSHGFKTLLSAEVPAVTAARLRPAVDQFLAASGLALPQIGSFVFHPGGPKILQGIQEGLGLTDRDMALSWASYRRMGNLNSASVLVMLRDLMDGGRPAKGSWGLLVGIGLGLCAELVLLQW